MKYRHNKKLNAYKAANEAFLQVKAQEEGMHILDNGVMYRVMEDGRGTKCPKPSGIVYVNYTGRLIDGTVFDSTEGQPLRHCSSSATSSWAGRSSLPGCTKGTSGRSISLRSGGMEP